MEKKKARDWMGKMRLVQMERDLIINKHSKSLPLETGKVVGIKVCWHDTVDKLLVLVNGKE